MVLSKSWGYAVRALVELGKTFHDPEKKWQAGELAEAANLPASFLSKVLTHLASSGLVQSTRGRGGGVQLARHPGDIRLIEVAHAIEAENWHKVPAAGFEDAPEEVRRTVEEGLSSSIISHMEYLAETSIEDLIQAQRETGTD